jgi:hypothetical protein
MKNYPSPYYTVHTDVDPEYAREAILRITRMAEEYHERTRTLFTGTINEKLPFYLFANIEDYYAAGGPPGSAGVFMGDKLMGVSSKRGSGSATDYTWHVIQHEGFHQFVRYVVRGRIPTWVNEGMAEYFGESIFTGDGMVTAVIPPSRCKRIKARIASGEFMPIKRMMYLSLAEWNSQMSTLNYDQAWSMCHYMAHGDGGKYQGAFVAFMQEIGRGNPWEKAWQTTFGSADGFEEKWKQYWLSLPDEATPELYTRAVVAMLTSFAGRAYSEKQTFDTFEQFIKTDAGSLKHAESDWLPSSLFRTAVASVARREKKGYKFELVPAKNKQPTIVCTMPDGEKLTGSFKLNGHRMASNDAVTVEMPKAITARLTIPGKK